MIVDQCTYSILQIITVKSFKLLKSISCWPSQKILTSARSLVHVEFTYIAISVSKDILSFTPHHILSKLSLILLKISEFVFPQTLLNPKMECSLIIITTWKILLSEAMRQTIFYPSNIFAPIFEYKLHLLFSFLLALQFVMVQSDILYYFILFQEHSLILLTLYLEVQGKIINPFHRVGVAQFVHAQAYFKKHRIAHLPFLYLVQLLDNVFSCTRTQPTSHPNYYQNLNNNPNKSIIKNKIIYLPKRQSSNYFHLFSSTKKTYDYNPVNKKKS